MTMSRAGIGSLMRAGPAPGRAGLSHLARGEAVIPNAAMQADPMLRQRAMMAMASRGRNPMQYTVGQQNMRNPSTGAPMYADIVYVDGQYVDASTGQPADFGGGENSVANIGTFAPPAAGTPKQYGTVMENDTMFIGAPSSGPSKLDTIGNVMSNLSTAIEQADSGYTAPTGPKYMPPTGGKTPGTIYSGVSDPVVDAPVFVPLPSPEPEPPSDFPSFSTPQTYDQWSQTRNPSGKNMPNTLFGQTQAGGADSGFNTGGMQMPNVLAGQIPVPGAQWGTPGTALGFGRENTANDPSVLRSGYNDSSLSQSIYSGAFGGLPGMVGQQSGIAFSGQNPMTGGGQSNQQKQYGGNFGFNSAFRY